MTFASLLEPILVSFGVVVALASMLNRVFQK
jgi:hypothetical protein